MRRWTRHFLFWVAVYILWTFMKSFGYWDINDWMVNIIHLSAYVAIYYTLTAWQIPRLFDRGRVVLFCLSLVLSTIAIVFVWYCGMLALSNFFDIPDTTLPNTYGGYILEGVQMFVPGMILLAWESYEAQQEEEERLHRMEKESISNEINYLKAQLNPQFLFNTLHTLKEFVDEKSPKAPEMILKLSEVLDYVLYKSQKDTVTVQEEADVIRHYMDLEKLRCGDGLNINLSTIGNLSSTIAPLTLFSIVENTMQGSTINRDVPMNVDISIRVINEEVDCIVHIPKLDHDVLNSNGLTEIKRQLALTYPDRHLLSQESDAYSITTSLTLRAAS